MNYFLIVALITQIGCGLARTTKTDEDFVKYVERFEQETGIKVQVPVFYGTIKEDFAAVCEVYSDGYKQIRVNSKYWTMLGELGKEELVYHELGHCVLNRDHTDSFTVLWPQGYSIPNSIMYPYVFGDSFFYSIYREHYVQELLNPELKLGE